jgi:hypothetical protein
MGEGRTVDDGFCLLEAGGSVSLFPLACVCCFVKVIVLGHEIYDGRRVQPIVVGTSNPRRKGMEAAGYCPEAERV